MRAGGRREQEGWSAANGRHPSRAPSTYSPRRTPQALAALSPSLSSVPECMGAPLTHRAQRMEVLPHPSEGRPRPRCRVVDGASAARHPARGVRYRHGRARRCRSARRSPRRSPRLRRHHLRAASGTQPCSSGDQCQPRRSHRRMALRPASISDDSRSADRSSLRRSRIGRMISSSSRRSVRKKRLGPPG